MRIGVDARWNYHGGVGVYVSNLLEVLPPVAESRGMQIIAYESPKRPIRTSHRNLRKIQLKEGCYSPKAQFELARRSRQDRLDLLHTPFYLAPFLVECPTIITIHDLIPFLFPVYGPVHRAIVKGGYRLSASKASHIATDSEATRNDVRRLLGIPDDRVTTIYCGLDHRVFRPDHQSGEHEYLAATYGITQPYVMTMSASNWRTKNLAGALTAIEGAKDRYPGHFQTVIAGSSIGLEQSGMRDQLRDAVVTGPVPASDLPKLYRNAAVFVTLSKYEGFGYPLAEAMACGTACVTSTGGSLPEIAADAAVCCPDGNYDAAANAIVELLSHPPGRKLLSEKAVVRSKAFSMEEFAESMITLYERVARQV